MIRKAQITAYAVACLLVTSCSVVAPVKLYESATIADTNWPVIWTENAPKRSSVITKVDGKSIRSRPYAVTVPPGMYTVSVYSFVRVDMPTIQATPYTNFDLTVTVEAGHNYVIRHEISADGKTTQPFLEDLGKGQSCKYVAGNGSAPIYLHCTSDAGSTASNNSFKPTPLRGAA
ncbi:hypothetical protein [Luteimonas sp. MC1572]|uniref:hypothetical protein n=1 Tax=Luteimonas sp. MC1572 TaxID=2799325 RepID=UPI0018F0FDA6|nr:hypothetical protein [Luteimonas sp. MC1572]MBJ6983026.1 hypothetical protein [Luteimonas sp. MC1572]QQO03256.1 hypothetical protein JGR64_00270 [Luteimonas sp. MC1572]